MMRTKIIARIAATAMRFEPVRRIAFRTISQIGVSYPDSALSQRSSGLSNNAPKAGDRFPWLRLRVDGGAEVRDLYRETDDTCFNLLVFGQPLPEQTAGGLVRTHVISSGGANDAELARAHIAGPSFYLLRPDGYIGLCGAKFDVALIAKYLAQQAHLKTSVVREQAA
jgi:hypothetical protein